MSSAKKYIKNVTLKLLWYGLHLVFFTLTIVVTKSCVSQAVEKENAEKSGRVELARQFVDSNQNGKAVSLLQSLSRQYPRDSNVQFLYGLALMGLKDISSARFRFGQAVELDEENDDARLSLGYTLIVLKQFKEAETELRKILDRATYSYMERVHVNLGLSELEQNRCPIALDSFERALELDPTLVTAYFNKGKCLVKLGKMKMAFDAFEKAVSFCPGCGEPQLELARVQFQLGMKNEAVANLRELMKLTESGEMRNRAHELLSKMNRKNGRSR